MTNNATFIRIFNSDPDDEFVRKRDIAIKEIASKIGKKKNVGDILQTANELVAAMVPKAQMSEGLAAQVETALAKQSEAFVPDGQHLQMLVCAYSAVYSILANAAPYSGVYSSHDLLATALWLGLSSQPPRSEVKLEALRFGVLELSQDLIAKTAALGRKRTTVPEIAVILGEDGTVGLDEKIKTGASKTIDALRTNAALDREEIDFLWWVLSERSELLNDRFGSYNLATIAVGAGLEAGQIVRRLPTEAHKNIVLRKVGGVDTMTATELLAALGSDREKLASQYAANTYVSSCPYIFSLTTSLVSGLAKGPSAKIKHSLQDWSARAFLESALLHLTHILPPALIN